MSPRVYSLLLVFSFILLLSSSLLPVPRAPHPRAFSRIIGYGIQRGSEPTSAKWLWSISSFARRSWPTIKTEAQINRAAGCPTPNVPPQSNEDLCSQGGLTPPGPADRLVFTVINMAERLPEGKNARKDAYLWARERVTWRSGAPTCRTRDFSRDLPPEKTIRRGCTSLWRGGGAPEGAQGDGKTRTLEKLEAGGSCCLKRGRGNGTYYVLING